MRTNWLLVLLALWSPALGMSRSQPTQTPTVISSPTPSSIPLSPSSIALKCTNCTSAQNNAIPIILQKYEDIRTTQCFSDYFTKQSKIDENQGLTALQIVAKLRVTPTNTTVTFYSVSWLMAAFHKECGADNLDGTITWKDSCFQVYTTCQRASFVGHEFSHGMGFTHYTAGNQEAGNEQTVPYLIDEAFAACCK